MPRPIDEFLAAWQALSGCSVEAGGWRGIPVTPAGPCRLMAARRFPGNEEALLAGFQGVSLAPSERLPEGKGFEVVRADPYGDGKTWIALTRKESGNPELFAEMVSDVAGAMDAVVREGEDSIMETLLRRIRMWQQFMSRGSTPLGPEAELGLVGELNFMAALLDSGVSIEEVLRGWVGPDDAPHDFLIGDGAIEVKATMSSSGFLVKIGSLEQLDDSMASPLFLAACRFSREGGGQTLPEMVAEMERRVTQEPGAVGFLRERLFVAGYTETHARLYTRRFEPRESRVLSVSDGFPRLTPGIVPAGITRTLYELNLDHAGEFITDLGSTLKALGASG
ncbi:MULTISPECIES: PD-(D/E)XK motif protein [unclassified Ectothiorhodospira]|uniref:PD-(D/E)XK motif protein n=1 Tax=unclassified Ectothiorhodospira TaxID=2684909 RepID=UPI001EE7C9AA|nr:MULTISPECIES: PD-(D/E)XK motif protein [unclassified Ectothiorhodospira]MCG5517223.1 PD-(D/E)XK motif protein [Ectothiorhodospira sp. 9100]MCG5519956.1 PD-(D/E)XK motif protein [Ectothiorhodospira sp. 9905]